MAIKFSSNYVSLQEAFDNLIEGDVLYIDQCYKISETLLLQKRNVQIIGAADSSEGTLSPASNGNPSPLIKIVNEPPSSPYLNNIVLSRIRILNAPGVAEGSGDGIAIQVVDDPAVGGSIWHLKFEDLDIENYLTGINIQNAFDIVFSSCQISGCQDGMVFESTVVSKIAGQIKLINGFCINNNTHIKIQGAAGATFDKVLGFGWSCGHKRTGIDGYATAISSSIATNGIILFGCHLEDLEYGIFTSAFIGMINAHGCAFGPINAVAIKAPNVGALSATGNMFSPTLKPFLDMPYVTHGVLSAGNQRGTGDIYPTEGLVEANISTDPPKMAYRISPFTTDERPAANSMPTGTIIFNNSTNKPNVSDGTNWRNPDGTIA